MNQENQNDNQTKPVGARRPRQLKVKVRSYRARKRPHLKFVVGYREDGRRKQSFFETREAAKNFADFKNKERKQNGVEAAEFPTWLRVMAQEAREKLEPLGASIREAADHYAKYLLASRKSCTAKELVEKLLKSKEAAGRSERHLSDLKSRLNRFVEQFKDEKVATISATQIEDFLRDLHVGAQSQNHYRSKLILAFKYAIKCGYAVENPAAKTDMATVEWEKPGILQVDEAARLLESANRQILPYIAIGLFAGLRRAELERLDWSEIDFESGLIEVTASKAKSGARRFVTMQPNLQAWLLPLRKAKGCVTPQGNFRELFTKARADAGIDQWPQNALRHSFASYHLAHFTDAAATALQLGHHDSRVTFAHYRELVRPKEAARYWQLKPAAKGSKKIVHMVAR